MRLCPLKTRGASVPRGGTVPRVAPGDASVLRARAGRDLHFAAALPAKPDAWGTLIMVGWWPGLRPHASATVNIGARRAEGARRTRSADPGDEDRS